MKDLDFIKIIAREKAGERFPGDRIAFARESLISGRDITYQLPDSCETSHHDELPGHLVRKIYGEGYLAALKSVAEALLKS